MSFDNTVEVGGQIEYSNVYGYSTHKRNKSVNLKGPY